MVLLSGPDHAYSVGPGAAAKAASFAIALDPNVISDVKIGAARLNRKALDADVHLISGTQTSSRFETRWRTSVTLKPGDRLDLDLKVTTRTLTADLPAIKHPLVGLVDMGSHITQRQTGQNSMSRLDSVWT